MSDRAIDKALRSVERTFGKLPIDHRTNFPSFTIYDWEGNEVGGG